MYNAQTRAAFATNDVANAIASAQAMIERLPYMGKKARRVQHEYTVEYEQGGVRIVDHYAAYDVGDAMRQFGDDYGVRASNAYRTKLSK